MVQVTPTMGLHHCKLKLVNRLCCDQYIYLNLNYHKYKKGKTYNPLCHKLMNDTNFGTYFHPNKELRISNMNVTYMNSLSLLRPKELAFLLLYDCCGSWYLKWFYDTYDKLIMGWGEGSSIVVKLYLFYFSKNTAILHTPYATFRYLL